MLACVSALGLLLNSESCHLPSVPDKAPKVRHTLKADGLLCTQKRNEIEDFCASSVGPDVEVTREW